MRRILLLSFLLLSFTKISAQSISGFIFDVNNQPIPFASVHVKYGETGTTSNAKGAYFIQFEETGEITLVVTSLGFEEKSLTVLLNENEDRKLDFYLASDAEVLDAVNITARKRDPAYEIISQAIEAKSKWKKQYQSSTCSMYIKAMENISEKEKKRREKIKELAEKQEENKKHDDDEDPLEKERKEREEAIKKYANSINMAEIRLTRHYKAPNLYKDIREGYKKYGQQDGLYFIETNQDQFDFYTNLMDLANLNELPLVSPLHYASVLTYKFKLEETTTLDNQLMYQIKVTPRKRGNASWEGVIWIQKGSFAILKVDLHLSKGGLLFYDEFNVKQTYNFLNDSTLLLQEEEFTYAAKEGGRNFKGNTVAVYSDYIINPSFEKRFFKNELSVTTEEAYERDSTYWKKNRIKKLTQEEQRYQYVKDSLYAVINSDHYKDSVDLEFNRVEALDVLWTGVEFTNWRKKRRYRLGSIPEIMSPFLPGGMRLGYGGSYFKKWDSEKHLSFNGRGDYGLRNENMQGLFSLDYKYDPMHFGHVGFHVGRLYNVIATNDAITNLLQKSNWLEQDYFGGYWKRELVNGLDITVRARHEIYRSIAGLKFGTLSDEWFENSISNWSENNEPLEFPTYKSTNGSIRLNYTPFRKYLTEPKRKVILGSKWPTFSFYYFKGINGPLNSSVDFDYLEASIKQNIRVSTLGTSTYKLEAGQFINTNTLNIVDFKIFPRGDDFFFASLMQSMQLQDTTIRTDDRYAQLHYVHHFNGALMNYIPLIRKTRLHMVLGASALYIPESDYEYVEGFFGAERTFRIQRSRLRFGLYFVAARSNLGDITPRLKFAVQRYNPRNRNWEY